MIEYSIMIITVASALRTVDQLILEEYDSPQAKKISEEEMITSMKRKCLSALRIMLRMFRLRVRRQKRIKTFFQRVQNNLNHDFKMDVIKIWKEYVEVVKKGRMLSIWTKRNNILAPCFQSWRMQQQREKRGKELVRKSLRMKALDCFRFLQYLSWSAKKKAQKKHKKRGSILCFFVRRIFRAWKLHTRDCRPNPLHVAGNIIRAIKFIKGRIFVAWSSYTSERATEHEILRKIIVNKKQSIIALSTFLQWDDVTRTTKYARHTACTKFLRKLSSFSKFRRRFVRNIRLGALRGMNYKARRVLKVLRSLVRKNKELKRVTRIVKNRRKTSELCWILTHWISLYRSSLADERDVNIRIHEDDKAENHGDAIKTVRYLNNDVQQNADNWTQYSKPPIPGRSSSSSSSLLSSGGLRLRTAETENLAPKGLKNLIPSSSSFSSSTTSSPESEPGSRSTSAIMRNTSDIRNERKKMTLVESVISRYNCDVSATKNVLRERLQSMRDDEIRQVDLNHPDEEIEYDDDNIIIQQLSVLCKYRTGRAIQKWRKQTVKLIKLKKQKEKLELYVQRNLLKKSFSIYSTAWIRSTRRRIKNMNSQYQSIFGAGIRSSGSGSLLVPGPDSRHNDNGVYQKSM